MIDQYNDDGTGWARFSDDMTMRYRLRRLMTPAAVASAGVSIPYDLGGPQLVRVVFVMLNPSTADAFKHDPTVGECIKRARAIGADVLEVVNLFALRSPHPADLKKCAAGYRGDDEANNRAIVEACLGAECVIAAWGNHGALGGRDQLVRRMLADRQIGLHHLGLTIDGFPKHPLARGHHRIPADLTPVLWTKEAA
jgi:hypothetical protein